MYILQVKHILLSKAKTNGMIGDEKNMKTKIIIGMLLLFLMIGVCFAANVNDFKGPNGWDNKGNGAFLGPVLGEGILVMEHNDENVKDYLDNVNVAIKKDNDSIMIYNDSDLSQHGAMEVVEKDGSKFIVQAWAGDEAKVDDAALKTTLQEFNKVNNVKPLEA